MAPRPAPAPELMDELVEEILLRIPPDDPARLLHAALVCKRWCRLVSAAGFRRRFREFHRTPPMLGFFHDHRRSYSFVSTSSFRRPPAALLDSHEMIDACHGRVLLFNLMDDDLMVWDPITGWISELPLPPPSSKRALNWNAAVFCASTGAGSTCDHLDCARGDFLVLYVCSSRTEMFAHVYSSETAAWSEEISVNMYTLPSAPGENEFYYMLPGALAENALYFRCSKTLLKYDLAAKEMFLTPMPRECWYGSTIVRTTEGGRLGLANISSDGVHLYLWSRDVGPEGNVGWTQSKEIKLRKLLPDVVELSTVRLAGFAHGLDVVVVRSSEGTFTVDLKSTQATKVHGKDCFIICYPYMSFYNPALGAASAEGSRSGTSHA